MSQKSSATRRLTIIAAIVTLAAAAGCVVLAQSSAGQIQDIYNFTGGAGGAFPTGPLIQIPGGQFVGATSGYGRATDIPPTVFRVDNKGSLTTLFNFAADGSQGMTLLSALVQASDGNFYGSTASGGKYNLGTSFRVTPSGSYTKLYDFTPLNEGGGKGLGGRQLVEAFDGNLYTTSSFGGVANAGTLTRTTLSGKPAILYSFGATLPGGAPPDSPLVLGADGMLYGLTDYYFYTDGTLSNGSVFRSDTNGNIVTIYIFTDPVITKGDAPPIIGSDGDLYMVSPTGGASSSCTVAAGCGSIYKIAADGSGATLLYSFTGGADGSAPRTLIKASDGKLYGTSWGNNSPSAIFQFDPVTSTVVSYPFPSGLLGTSFPLLQALGGNFMDVTNTSGALPYGAVFSAALGLPPAGPSILGFRPQSGGAGTLVTIWGSNFVGVTGVTVNGSPAKFRNTASGFVSFAVPQGASSGSVTVTTPGGTAVSSGAFSVE